MRILQKFYYNSILRSLCSRTTAGALFKLNPQLNAARSVTIKVLPTPAPITETYDEKAIRMNRPQSPHLTIYKYQLTAVLSITHRMTGTALTGYAAALGMGAIVLPDGANSIVTFIEALELSSPTLMALKFIVAFPPCYHAANGVRHLVWDMGKCLSIKEVYTTGYAMVVSATILAGILSML